jgi:hypothetical protein
MMSSIVVIGLAFPKTVPAGETDPLPTITVLVFNHSHASPAILVEAEREAGRIFGEAGLRVAWLECPMPKGGLQGACQTPLKETDLMLRIASAPLGNSFQDTVFGFAANPAVATVYYEYVVNQAMSDDAEFEAPMILGCVVAHEIGHLLLGSNSHSSAGIMQPHWQRKQILQRMRHQLLFTTEQSKLMRAEARTRMRPPTGTLKDERRDRFDGQGDLSWSQATNAPARPAVQETQSLARIPVKLPIRVFWDYLVIVEGSIGNAQKLHFLVDTGAYPSVVDQKIAHNLGLADQPARVNLANKSVQTRLVVLPSLLLGPLHAEALPVLTEDLSFLRKALGYKVDAIVGLDVLRKSSFTINYKTKEMLFGPVERLTFSAPFETDTPLVTIRTRFEDRQLRLMLDTGTPDLMLFQSRMPDSTNWQTLGTEKTANVSGTFRNRKVRISEVYLGKETIGAQIASVVDDRKDDGDNFDGVLGVRGPQFWKIAFDFEHRRFCWER